MTNFPSSSFIEGLNCTICLVLKLNPMNCSSCGQIICRECIKQYNEKSDQCPYCRKSPVQYNEISKGLKNSLENMKMTCIYYDKGCNDIIILKNYKDHIDKCKFQNNENVMKQCEFCRVEFPPLNFDNHKSNKKECFQKIHTELMDSNLKVKNLKELCDELEKEKKLANQSNVNLSQRYNIIILFK